MMPLPVFGFDAIGFDTLRSVLNLFRHVKPLDLQNLDRDKGVGTLP